MKSLGMGPRVPTLMEVAMPARSRSRTAEVRALGPWPCLARVVFCCAHSLYLAFCWFYVMLTVFYAVFELPESKIRGMAFSDRGHSSVRPTSATSTTT